MNTLIEASDNALLIQTSYKRLLLAASKTGLARL